MTDTSCSDSDVSQKGKDSLSAGSKAFLNNSPLEAVENFKSVLEKSSSKSNQKISMSQLVLRYALCVALIKCNDYKHIAEAATIILELLESGYGSKLPALYLALGNAYFALYRFKSALDTIEKGLKTIQTYSKIKQHMWPGLQQPIDDTMKENLLKELLSLQKDCKEAHSPDAVCRFDKCIEHSTHLIPTQDIYLTDPDFKPFLYIQCNSNCKYAYHYSCWEHLKGVLIKSDEPKDILGTACSLCSSKINNDSIIVEVNLIGSEFGFDKPIYTWLLEEDKCSKITSRNLVQPNISSPLKNNVKPVASNGSLKSVMADRTSQYPTVATSISKPRMNPGPAPAFFSQPNFLPNAPMPPMAPMYGFNFVLRPNPMIYCPTPGWNQWCGAPLVTANPPTHHHPTPIRVTVTNSQTLIMPVGPPGPGGPYNSAATPEATGRVRELPSGCQDVTPLKSVIDLKRDVYQVSEEEAYSSPVRSTANSTGKPESSKKVIDEFKNVVWKLAGECSRSPSPNLDKKEGRVKSKEVVTEFQSLVAKLGGDGGRDRKTEQTTAPTDSLKEPAPHQEPEPAPHQEPEPAPNQEPKYAPYQEPEFAPYKEPEFAPYKEPEYAPYQEPEPAPYQEPEPAPYQESEPAPYQEPEPAPHQLFNREPSTFQANPKLAPKEDDSYSEHSSLCSSQDDITSESLDSSKLTYLLDTLHQCRKMEFGYSPSEYMNPELQCFGHPYVSSSNFVDPNEIDESDRDQADFVFSYYYSVFERNGLHRLEDLQEMWKTTITDLELPESFTNKYSNVAEFLLKSEKFAAIDEFIGTSDLLPDMFSKAQVEIAESVSFLLFSQEQNTISQDEHLSADTFNNAWKIKMNNNNCDPHTHHIQSSDSSSDRSDEHVAVSKDNNDNPLLSTTPEVNGNSNSGCNASSMNDVYMSDEDEEIDTSLVLDGVENGKGRDVPFKWNESKTKPDVVSKHSQTDQILDAEKENLAKSKDSLLKEVSELRFEKGELHQRIETLQSQMENNRTSMESIHKSTLKQTQEQHSKELLEKTNELKEIRDKHFALEQTITQLRAKVDERESEVAKLTSSLQKVQRNHAKEMNNFEEGMKNRLADSINQSKYKDQRYIQLWKDFCEFKINKFNQSCNDRINVLSQLRDMVSESVHPTKSDIISIIEKYEDSMISVTQKNAEVNDLFNQQMEKMRSGLEVFLPAVVDIPDLNMPYPPEGVFDYLRSNMKPKQDDFAVPPVPQNHFLSGNSRFYPRSFNGLQSRENEGFASAPSSSIFGQGHNETSHLWNTMGPFPISSDVSNTTTPQFQGFGSSNPLMQQSTLNLMPSLMSYPSSSSNSLLGQRASPSPLSNMNGSAFTPAPTTGLPSALGALAAPGSKLPSLGSNPKLPATSSSAAVNQVVKPMASTVPAPAPAPVSAPATVSSQGAIPKPKVATATASMTPIVASTSRPKPVTFKGVKSESNYEKLMRNLQKMFPTRNDMELTQALKMARERNNNTLSSLSHSEIVSKVEEILNSFRKQTSMSWEKFGQAAWGTAKTPVIEWEGQEQDECCICMNAMHIKEIYTLECKHAFHKDCIKKWLEQESVCPNCRTHSTMVDEFPPLA